MRPITSLGLFISLIFIPAYAQQTKSGKLAAPIQASAPSAAQPAPEPQVFADVRPLYKEGKYVEMQSLLESYLREHPDDAKAQSQLAIAMIHQSNAEGARVELHLLQASTNPDAKRYTAGLERLVADEDARLRAKSIFLESVKKLRAKEAEAAVAASPLTPIQKTTLSVFLMNFEGRFGDAHDALTALRSAPDADVKSLDALSTSTGNTEEDTKKVRERLEVYLHSALAPSYVSQDASWLAANPEFEKLSLQEYQDLVLKLNQLTPLNSDAIDLMFHATMLFGNEQATEQMGDKVLSAKGKIVLPCYSNDRFFNLVIDGENKEIYTQDDPHPFEVANATKYKQKKPEKTDKHIAKLVPFRLKFGDIHGLKQNGAVTLENMKNEDYALEFEPGQGTVPQYALMRMTYAFGGWKAEMQATRNLGDFVQHVVKSQADLNAQLQVVKAPSTAGQTFTMALLAVGGAMQAGMGNAAGAEQAQMALQMQQTQMAKLAVIGDQQQAQVGMLKSSDIFNEQPAGFADLEKLVGLVN